MDGNSRLIRVRLQIIAGRNMASKDSNGLRFGTIENFYFMNMDIVLLGNLAKEKNKLLLLPTYLQQAS